MNPSERQSGSRDPGAGADPAAAEPLDQQRGTVGEVLAAFAVRGVTSFGGPVAHLAYFRDAFVRRRRWLSEDEYADLVALCQFLPGPASSQVGMAIGLLRAGFGGMLVAWLAFTLPSAILLVLFGLGVEAFGLDTGAGWIQGLKAAAVAVVAHAVLGMARSLAPDPQRATIAVGALVGVLLVPTVWAQVAVIAAAGLVGLVWLRTESPEEAGAVRRLDVPVPRGVAIACLVAFVVLLGLLPVAALVTSDPVVGLVDDFYRSGALVFGGGHVILPLLEDVTVPSGMVDHDTFLAGYGAAQAVPGPLFTFAAYLGAVSNAAPTGVAGAAVALLAIFLPSALLIVAALPFWEHLRRARLARRALLGVNAGVVGILAAALYDPVFTQGVPSTAALVIAAAAFVALGPWKAPAWAVVIVAGVAGYLLL